mgnify:CR=1 FL=1
MNRINDKSALAGFQLLLSLLIFLVVAAFLFSRYQSFIWDSIGIFVLICSSFCIIPFLYAQFAETRNGRSLESLINSIYTLDDYYPLKPFEAISAHYTNVGTIVVFITLFTHSFGAPFIKNNLLIAFLLSALIAICFTAYILYFLRLWRYALSFPYRFKGASKAKVITVLVIIVTLDISILTLASSTTLSSVKEEIIREAAKDHHASETNSEKGI